MHIHKGYGEGLLRHGAAWRHITGLLWNEGDLFFSEGPDHTIRKVQRTDQNVVPFAGLRGNPLESQEGGAGHLNLPGPMACIPPYLYVVDTGSHSIKRILADGSGIPEVFAGTPGVAGGLDGSGAAAQFSSPADIVADLAAQVLLVADRGNDSIRLISLDGTVRTLQARVHGPQGLALDRSSGKLFVACTEDSVIQSLEPAGGAHLWGGPLTLSNVAGRQGHSGFSDGHRDHALFNRPMGLAIDPVVSLLWVADSGNNLIRRIRLTTDQVDTFSGDPHGRKADLVDGMNTEACYAAPSRLALGEHPWVLYVGDQQGRALRWIDPTGRVETLGAHAAQRANGAKDGPGATARFDKPLGVAVGRDGAAYVADRDNHAIRRVDTHGSVSTYAGALRHSGSADGFRGDARFQAPSEVAMDGAGRLYVLEPGEHRLRRLDPDGQVHTVLRGDDAPAAIASCAMEPRNVKPGLVMSIQNTSHSKVILMRDEVVEDVVSNAAPAALALDASGAVLVLTAGQPGHYRLSRYAKSGGDASPWQEVAVRDLDPQAHLGLSEFQGMAVDSKGAVFLADTSNALIWKVSADLRDVEIVAGKYPFLAPIPARTGLDSPLYQVHRLAVTPMDDLIASSGHAVVQVSGPGTPGQPWTPPRGGAVSPQPGSSQGLRFSAQDLLDGKNELGSGANRVLNPKTNGKDPEPDSADPLRARLGSRRENLVVEDPDDVMEEDLDHARLSLQRAVDAEKVEEERVRGLEAKRKERLARKTQEQLDQEKKATEARVAKSQQGRGDLLDQIRNGGGSLSSSSKSPAKVGTVDHKKDSAASQREKILALAAIKEKANESKENDGWDSKD